MDFGNGKKRKTHSVQDMIRNDSGARKPLQKSGYQGAYRRGEDLGALMGTRSQMEGPSRNYSSTRQSSFIGDYGWVIFAGLLVICVVATCVVYGVSNKPGKFRYPTDVFTISGVLTDIYSGNSSGGAKGSSVADNSTVSDPSDATGNGEAVSDSNSSASATDTTSESATGNEIKTSQSSTVGATSGAPMTIDDGTMSLSFPEAGSYEELLTQLESAIASGDVDFVGSKIGYFDGSSTLGYPQSVVDTFVNYMAGNADKRETFLKSIASEEKYGSRSGEAIIVSLPIIQFKVTTEYNNTIFSFSGFAEQVIQPGQQAVISPLLPCMYTISAKSDSWEQPVEGPIEATFGENLEVNFGAN